MRFPWWSNGKDCLLPMQGAWVQSLVWDIPHAVRCGQKKKKVIATRYFCYFLISSQLFSELEHRDHPFHWVFWSVMVLQIHLRSHQGHFIISTVACCGWTYHIPYTVNLVFQSTSFKSATRHSTLLNSENKFCSPAISFVPKPKRHGE